MKRPLVVEDLGLDRDSVWRPRPRPWGRGSRMIRYGDYHRMSDEDPILYPAVSPSMVVLEAINYELEKIGGKVEVRDLRKSPGLIHLERQLEVAILAVTNRHGWKRLNIDIVPPASRWKGDVRINLFTARSGPLRSPLEINEYLQLGEEPHG